MKVVHITAQLCKHVCLLLSLIAQVLIWGNCYRSVYAIKPLSFSADHLCTFKVQFVKQVMHLKAVCFVCLTATHLLWTLGTRWRFLFGFTFWMKIEMKLRVFLLVSWELRSLASSWVMVCCSRPLVEGPQGDTKQRQENSRKCTENASENWENKGTASEPR